MDPNKIRAAQERLGSLSEQRGHTIRSQVRSSSIRPEVDELERRLRDLAGYTLELEEVLRELLGGLAADG
jgi:hypothetical protein